MIRLLGVCVAVLGIASLVFGIVFVVMSSSARTEIIDGIADEGWPMFAVSDNYPYVTVTEAAMTQGDIIDTAEDVDDALDALEDIRGKMVGAPAGIEGFQTLFGPSTFVPQELDPPDGYGMTVDTLMLHEYSAVLSFTSVLGAAKAGLGTASLMQIIGIVTILVGVALMLTGLVVFKLVRSR